MNTLNEMNYISSDGDADSLMGRFHSIVERNILRHVKNGFYPVDRSLHPKDRLLQG